MTRGWCPGVFTPMTAPDGLLVRVKPRLGRLPAEVARTIAEQVARHANGRIALTSRANLQIRGLSEHGSDAFARAMVACGAADADPRSERRRNIVVSPLAGDDPSIRGRPEIVANALQHALAVAHDLRLSDKFGFAVDGGGRLPLGDTGADVVLRTELAGCRIQIAGATRAIVCAEAEAAAIALALARAFLTLGGTRRMRDLVAAIGEQAIYHEAGCHADAVVITPEAVGIPEPVVAIKGLAACAVSIAPPHGELEPASLADLAAFARDHGDGVLRVAPWRALLVCGVRREHAARCLALAA